MRNIKKCLSSVLSVVLLFLAVVCNNAYAAADNNVTDGPVLRRGIDALDPEVARILLSDIELSEEYFGGISVNNVSTIEITARATIGGSVEADCLVFAPFVAESVSLLCLLREENDYGNLIIVDIWRESSDSRILYNYHTYSPAVQGKEYEVAVRAEIHYPDGSVKYDFLTLSGVYAHTYIYE